LLNALPLNVKICRNDTRGSKPAFKEYIRVHFLYCEREFTSIYKKCTRSTMYMTYALLYSTLRNITVQRRPQKRNLSSTRLWWCGTVTIFESSYINFEKKMYGCSTTVTNRMALYLKYNKHHIINICTTYNLRNVQKFYSFLYKHNLPCTWCPTFNSFHLYLMPGVLESTYSEKRS
jgi:hypothetical protein